MAYIGAQVDTIKHHDVLVDRTRTTPCTNARGHPSAAQRPAFYRRFLVDAGDLAGELQWLGRPAKPGT